MTNREHAELQAAEAARGLFAVVLVGYGERQQMSLWGDRTNAEAAAEKARQVPRPNGYTVTVERR